MNLAHDPVQKSVFWGVKNQDASMRIRQLLAHFICTVLATQLWSQSMTQVEPPFWWIGMKNPLVQLMVHGQNIADARPQVKGTQLGIRASHVLESSNYIFVDLEIGEDVKPGTFDIEFEKDGQIVATYAYELKAREEGSAERRGFDNSDVMYLITPDRFANGTSANDVVGGMKEGLDRAAPFGRHGGDIKGISDHLDYIKDLGFTAIWLNPVLENDQPEQSYHGYATTDYYKVDPRFGSNEEYANLSDKASDMGIGLIMDIIVNHCGSEHWWMKDPPSQDWIHQFGENYQQTNHRKFTLVDPYVAENDRSIMTKGWFVPTMPDLNQRNPFLATYLIQNSIWWIEYAGLSGIRQDTYSYPFRDFMTDWTCAIMDEYPNFNIVGEEWVENPAIIAYWQEGKMNPDGYTSCLPSLMDFPMTMTLQSALRDDEGWSTGWTALYENLGNDFLYAHPQKMVIFPDNHDMSRIFTQVNEDYDLYKMALSYILTMRGTPQLYYGTEILMSNKGTDSHGIIRSDFPGGWEGDQVDVFKNIGLTNAQLESRDFVKKLLNWRKDKEVIHHGQLRHYVPANGMYVYFRFNHEETIMIILNKNRHETRLELSRFSQSIGGANSGADVLSGAEYDLTDSLQIPAQSSLILELK